MIHLDESKLTELLDYMISNVTNDEAGQSYLDCYTRLSELAYPGSTTQDSGYSEENPDSEQSK